MTPEVIRHYAIHVGFDLMAAVVFIAAVYLCWRHRFAQEMTNLSVRLSGRYFTAVGLGAVAGAWFLGTLNNILMGDFAPARSVLGGLAGAIIAVEAWKKTQGLEGSTGYIYALPLAAMIAIGRLGCLFSGLDDNTYGVPTGLRWGWDFGDGILRHPVALYESASMLILTVFFMIALWRRVAWYPHLAFYIFAGVYGAQRFAWEFLKPYPPMLGALNLFHVTCLAMMVYALYFGIRQRKR